MFTQNGTWLCPLCPLFEMFVSDNEPLLEKELESQSLWCFILLGKASTRIANICNFHTSQVSTFILLLDKYVSEKKLYFLSWRWKFPFFLSSQTLLSKFLLLFLLLSLHGLLSLT